MKVKCPVCGSRVVFFRIRTQDYVCRRCGSIFSKELATKEKENYLIIKDPELLALIETFGKKFNVIEFFKKCLLSQKKEFEKIEPIFGNCSYCKKYKLLEFRERGSGKLVCRECYEEFKILTSF